jgi:hypothetical protein
VDQEIHIDIAIIQQKETQKYASIALDFVAQVNPIQPFTYGMSPGGKFTNSAWTKRRRRTHMGVKTKVAACLNMEKI